jgi:sarcosine oxidase subunit alpha
MLREDGFVMDDGTTSRLAPDHFIMTTTTANAVGIMRHLEFCHQCLWPNLDVQMASISEQWAQMAIAGPKSRETLARIVDRQHDISDAAFAYLTARDVTVLGGTRARLFRISYSGELAYELAVPAGAGSAVATAIMKAGADLGIQPYGLEAMGIMRIEKGHVAGNEINGQTTARDLGLGKMMSKKKDYIGRVLAERPALVMPDRWGLVGLKPLDWTVRIRAGAHLIPIGAAATTANDLGYVTSVAFSPTLERWIGLGLIAGGASKHGTRVRLVDLLRGTDVEAEVCDPVFYDPKGERLHG